MGITFFKEPVLEKPVLICSWPGIGRIGVLAVDYLRRAIGAEELGEIEPWHFFNPHTATVQDGLLKELKFPTSKFYYQKLKEQDLILFIGEKQPSDDNNPYAAGEKAYKMANMVLDVAEKYNCSRIYTSGAAITQIHHSAKSRVWSVSNDKEFNEELQGYENTVRMSDAEDSNSQGAITGLNGLLIGAARKRGIKTACLMGEIPYYLQGSPWPYHRGAQSVLEVLAASLKTDIDVKPLAEIAAKMENNIEAFLDNMFKEESIPLGLRDNIKETIARLKHVSESDGPITDEDQKRIMEHLDEFFKHGDDGSEKAS